MHSSARCECPRELAPAKGALTSRWASAADIERYYGAPLPRTVRARIIALDGEPVAIVGIVRWPGHYVFFSEYRAEARELLPRVPVMRAVAMVVELIKKERLPVFSIADEPDGPRVLKRLGFVAVEGVEGVFVWPN